MPIETYFLGDVGVALKQTTGFSWTGATAKQVTITRPSGTVITKTATSVVVDDASSGQIHVLTASGDLSETGEYLFQAKLTTSTVTRYGPVTSFKVESVTDSAVVSPSADTILRRTYDVGSYGAIGDGFTDDTAAIQAAIDAAEDAGGGVVYFPVGTFLTTNTLTIANHRVQIQGASVYKSKIQLEPTTGGKKALSFTMGATMIVQCSVKDISIASADSTYQKTAIELKDISEFVLENVQVCYPFTGADSVGIHMYGRDTSTFRKLSIAADIPFQVSQNPNHANIDCDCMHFEDLYFLGDVGYGHPNFLIDGGCVVTNTVMDGANVFIKGSAGVSYVSTTEPSQGHSFAIRNLRWEDGLTTGNIVKISLSAWDIRGLELTNLVTGFGGIYLRGASNATITNYHHLDNALVGLDVDNCHYGIALINCTIMGSISVADATLAFMVGDPTDGPYTAFYTGGGGWTNLGTKVYDLAHQGTLLGFYNTAPITQPALAADPTAAQISTALHTLGLVS